MIKLELPPMNFADDAVAAIGAIIGSVAEGGISAGEAASFGALIDTYTRAIEMADVVKRLDELKSKLNGDA